MGLSAYPSHGTVFSGSRIYMGQPMNLNQRELSGETEARRPGIHYLAVWRCFGCGRWTGANFVLSARRVFRFRPYLTASCARLEEV